MKFGNVALMYYPYAYPKSQSGRCRGFYILNTTNTMEIIEHLQQGSLPTKMVNWPVNLKEAKALADKYDELAEAGGLSDRWKLRAVTGFGSANACTLCKVTKLEKWMQPDCEKCLYNITDINGSLVPCAHGDSEATYDALESEVSSENLRNRASYIRSVINRFE